MPGVVNDMYEFGEFRMDVQNRILRRGQNLVPLTPKAFEVLQVLVQKNGEVIAKDELMNAAWPDSFVEESNLTQTVFMLRKALGETRDQPYILTVPGRGYRFIAPVIKPAPVKEPAALPAQSPDHRKSDRQENLPLPGAATARWRRHGSRIPGGRPQAGPTSRDEVSSRRISQRSGRL